MIHVQAQSCPTAAHQATLSMEFSRQEYCNGLPFPTPGSLLNPGIESACHASPAFTGRFFTTGPPGKPHINNNIKIC